MLFNLQSIWSQLLPFYSHRIYMLPRTLTPVIPIVMRIDTPFKKKTHPLPYRKSSIDNEMTGIVQYISTKNSRGNKTFQGSHIPHISSSNCNSWKQPPRNATFFENLKEPELYGDCISHIKRQRDCCHMYHHAVYLQLNMAKLQRKAKI